MTTDTRTFHIGDILTITTGCLVSPDHIDGVYRILNHMTGDNLFIHQLPRAADECAPALREQHPDLAAVIVPDGLRGETTVAAWLADQVAHFGETREVAPLPAGAHTRKDPLLDLVEMTRPGQRIIPIVVDGAA